MLAPRKKLWSSPKEVIDSAIELLNLQPEDICFDVGCGDGRFLFRCVEVSIVGKVVGIEIEEGRCDLLRNKISSSEDLCDRCEVVCGNALDQDYTTATCFFMYLIPHGLKTVYKNILKKIVDKKIRVVTYMSPLPELEPMQVLKVETSAHAEGEWPLYYYEIFNPGVAEQASAEISADCIESDLN